MYPHLPSALSLRHLKHRAYACTDAMLVLGYKIAKEIQTLFFNKRLIFFENWVCEPLPAFRDARFSVQTLA